MDKNLALASKDSNAISRPGQLAILSKLIDLALLMSDDLDLSMAGIHLDHARCHVESLRSQTAADPMLIQ